MTPVNPNDRRFLYPKFPVPYHPENALVIQKKSVPSQVNLQTLLPAKQRHILPHQRKPLRLMSLERWSERAKTMRSE